MTCPDNKPGFCPDCESGSCHECQGYGNIDTGQALVPCGACRATGWLSAQRTGIEDPAAQEAVGRAEKGWEP